MSIDFLQRTRITILGIIAVVLTIIGIAAFNQDIFAVLVSHELLFLAVAITSVPFLGLIYYVLGIDALWRAVIVDSVIVPSIVETIIAKARDLLPADYAVHDSAALMARYYTVVDSYKATIVKSREIMWHGLATTTLLYMSMLSLYYAVAYLVYYRADAFLLSTWLFFGFMLFGGLTAAAVKQHVRLSKEQVQLAYAMYGKEKFAEYVLLNQNATTQNTKKRKTKSTAKTKK